MVPALLEELRQVRLFAGLPEDELRWAAGCGVEVRLADGETLFEEGEPAEHFFVLLEGEIGETKRIDGQETALTAHQAGTFTGEIPLLVGTPYLATARAVGAGC